MHGEVFILMQPRLVKDGEIIVQGLEGLGERNRGSLSCKKFSLQKLQK